MSRWFVRLSFWNKLVLAVSFLAIVYHLGEIYQIHQNWNPLLPDYAFDIVIGSHLNFLIIFFPFFVVGTILYLFKNHLLSIIILLVLLQMSLFLDEHLEWYKLVV